MGMVESGTVLVGDVSNTLITPGLIASSGLRGVVFHELIGFAAMDPDRIVREADARLDEHRTLPLEVAIVAHAPYSVSPDLIAAIARAPRTAPLAIHLGESSEEMEFIATGGGLIEVTTTRVSILTDLAVAADRIDEAKAEEARRRAEARLREKLSDEEVASVNASLARSLAQLRVKRRQRR